MTFKALGEHTHGVFSLMEREMPPNSTFPPAHVHDGAEAFYVLAGRLTFVLADREESAGAGGFVLVPGGAAHTFGNRTGERARLLIVHAPAADAYFRDLEALWAARKPPDVNAQTALLAKHGMTPAS
jgi:mannose-6-phosphate isomerase-like protein (cupin superfamily)